MHDHFVKFKDNYKFYFILVTPATLQNESLFKVQEVLRPGINNKLESLKNILPKNLIVLLKVIDARNDFWIHVMLNKVNFSQKVNCLKCPYIALSN